MYRISCDVVVIGAGPAGLAAAISAKEEGAREVLIVERDSAPGGILQQCIHPGFGLTRFKEELTGPEYSSRFTEKAEKAGVKYLFNSMALEVNAADRRVVCVSAERGLTEITAGAVVLAMGCRERTRAGIAIPGTRPAGLYTAGAAQRLINRQNIMVGKRAVILGSGDVGMIMARRLTLEGAQVAAVVEITDYLAGLTRNRVQCLDDFGIPLMLSHTITRIEGERRVTGVYVAPVDENRTPILEKEEYVPCDTVLFSVGLIPENELTAKCGISLDPVTNGPSVNQYMQTSAGTVFACGNVVHVNDLVDNVSAESERAGRYAARYAAGRFPERRGTAVCKPGRNVRYVCPQTVALSDGGDRFDLYFRVREPENDVAVAVSCGAVIASRKELRVNPGEMVHIAVDPARITGDLTVEVKEGINK